MDEAPEIPQKERVVMSPELADRIDRARQEIAAQGQDPQAVAGRNIAEMGFMKALWETAKPHTKKLREIQFKQIKAQGAAVLSLIPIIGEGKAFLSTVGITKGFEKGVQTFKAEKGWRKIKAIGKGLGRAMAENAPEAAKAGSLFEKARAGSVVAREQAAAAVRAENIAKNIAVSSYETARDAQKALKGAEKWNKAVTKVAINESLDAAAAAAGKTGVGKWAFKEFEKRKLTGMKIVGNPEKRAGIWHFLDLTPDVPGWLSLTTAAGEMVGVHGIDVIPAVLQMGKNTIDQVSTYGKLTKDVWNLAVTRLSGKGKEVARATAAFELRPPVPAGGTV